MSPRAAPTRPLLGLILILGAMTAMAPMGVDMYLPSLPAIGAELRADAAEMQMTVAAFLIGLAVGQLVYGPLSDRIGRRGPVLIGVAIFVVASAACALATTPEQLIASRVMQAVGGCVGAVVSRAIVRDSFDHVDTARMLSLIMMVMGLAPILAPLVGSAVLLVAGWRMNFWIMAAYGAVLWVAILFRLKETRSAEVEAQARSEHPFRSYLTMFQNRRLMGFALASALNGATTFTYIASSPSLLIGTYGISPAHFGFVFGLNSLAIIGSSQLNRLLLRRGTPEKVLVPTTFASLAAGVALALAAVSGVGERWTVLPALFLVLGSFGFTQGNAMACALNIDPRRAGSVSGLMGSGTFVFGASTAALAGLLSDGTPRPMALIMLACLVGSTIALFTLALPKSESTAHA